MCIHMAQKVKVARLPTHLDFAQGRRFAPLDHSVSEMGGMYRFYVVCGHWRGLYCAP